ncbi:alpha/beta hydrolase [Paenibacillus donghaensis]|uniref:alpha/beta hydrolase n=1 Tax=Paenibacillus donghaensis TaxID=414771 RepID=UPI001B804D1E|nr:alpha/beta hydrolase [Paenibacillus donghaensis]
MNNKPVVKTKKQKERFKIITQTGNYIFNLSDKVTRKLISFNNRFGIKIAADLYMPKDFDESKKHAAVIIGAPYCGVKEQGPGVYANNLAEHLHLIHRITGTAVESRVTLLPLNYL